MVKDVVVAAVAAAMFLLAAGGAVRAQVQPSAACGAAAPDHPPAAVRVGGHDRGLIVIPPADTASARPQDLPHDLVVAFHGRTTANARLRRYLGLEDAARRPTVFVYPAGRQDAQGRYTWADPGDAAGAQRDLALFDAALAVLARSYCLDLGRVFVVGHSLGASFANSLACARGSVIRAVATVAGGISRPEDCTGPVAALVMHNPRDRLVPLAEGLRVRRSLLAQNGLEAGSRPAPPRRFNCRRYGPADSRHPVLWCPHADDRTGAGRFYPHQWPEGAGAAIMAFFAGLE